MIRPSTLALGIGALVALSSCGQPLGAYEVDRVQLVPSMTLTADGHDPGYGQYFQIDLVSTTDLDAFTRGDAVYADADLCPLRDRNGLVAFGPGADLRDVTSSEIGEIADNPRRSDGRYGYRVYIVAAHPMPGVDYSASWADQQKYDLRTTDRDVCIRFHVPGYDLLPSRSHEIRVPAGRFVEAARRGFAGSVPTA